MANESRLIKADSLMERFRIVAQSGGPVVVHVSDICAAIEDEVYETTKDAVEVVRCKDCKYFVQGEPYDPCECTKWIARFAVAYTEPHGYCHKAERKDNV